MLPPIEPRRQPSTPEKPHYVAHDLGCGERMPCPIHGMPFGPHYRPAERLHNGDVLAHDCGQRWRPYELAA